VSYYIVSWRKYGNFLPCVRIQWFGLSGWSVVDKSLEEAALLGARLLTLPHCELRYRLGGNCSGRGCLAFTLSLTIWSSVLHAGLFGHTPG